MNIFCFGLKDVFLIFVIDSVLKMSGWSFILFLPASLTLAVLLLLLMLKDKVPAQKAQITFLLAAMINLFLDAFLIINWREDLHVHIIVLIIFSLTSALICPAYINYSTALTGSKKGKGLILTITAISLIVFLILITLYQAIGEQEIEEWMSSLIAGEKMEVNPEEGLVYMFIVLLMAQLTAAIALHIIVIMYAACLLYRNAFSFKTFSAFWKGDYSPSPANITNILAIVVFTIIPATEIIGHGFFHDHLAIAVARSVLIASILFPTMLLGAIFPGQRANLNELLHPFERDNLIPDQFADIPIFSKNPEKQESDPFVSPLFDIKIRYDEYMSSSKAFLNPDTTAQSVADALNTNRTYLSMMINKMYGNTFPGHIAGMRVNHAKKLIVNQPDLPMSEISERSGFASTSQFSRKFKEITGYTPSGWRSIYIK